MFTDPHVAVLQRPEGRWELLREVEYQSDKKLFLVQLGYQTDFATVPRVIWWLVPTYGDYTSATVLHDWLITDALPRGRVTAREVDRIFREAMRELGVSTARRWLMWTGVRWGAIGNPKRRKGSLVTFPGVLAISLLALPFALPAVVVLPSLYLFSLLERL